MAVQDSCSDLPGREPSDGARLIAPVPASIAAFVGWAPIGPLDEAGHVGEWSDYERLFGGLHGASYLGHAVSHFFANGGREAYIVRLAGPDPDGPPPRPDAFRESMFPATVTGGGLWRGIHCLERVDVFNLLCVSGLTDLAALADLARFCREHRAFLIADAPDTKDPSAVEPVPGEDGINAAIYYPWLRIADPRLKGRLRTFPPSGAIAGVYARMDANRGVWKAPAVAEASVAGVAGLTREFTGSELDALNSKGINALRTLPGQGPVVWGARTCQGAGASDPEWKYVQAPRTALFIEQSLRRGLQWTTSEPNREPLWAQIRRDVGDFMHDLFRKGALCGATPEDAWFVKCDQGTTSQNDIDAGIVTVVAGFAPLRPAEFVILTLRQAAGEP